MNLGTVATGVMFLIPVVSERCVRNRHESLGFCLLFLGALLAAQITLSISLVSFLASTVLSAVWIWTPHRTWGVGLADAILHVLAGK